MIDSDFSFSKGLRHDPNTGLPDDDRYPYPTQGEGEAWRSDIPLIEPHCTTDIKAEEPEAVDQGAMLNVYWMALLRDVPFNSYDTEDLALEAKAELARFHGVEGFELGEYSFAPGRWQYDEAANTGSYVSQFLLDDPDIPYDGHHAVQVFNRDIGKTTQEVAAIQSGDSYPAQRKVGKHLPVAQSGRTLAMSVRNDWPAMHWINAYIAGLSLGLPINPEWESGNGHATWQRGGPPHITALITDAMHKGMDSGFPMKWNFCRLRPISLAARLNDQLVNDNNWGFEDDLINSQAVRLTRQRQGNALLSQAYENPPHPAYPAGHATCAGAGATILRSVFKDGPYPTPTGRRYGLTIHGELIKLATNECAGRMWAGIHYDSDNWLGLPTGEDAARELLIAGGWRDPGTVFAVDSHPAAA